MPAQINWLQGGHPGNIDKMRADLETHRKSDAQYVLVHIADFAWLLDQVKAIEDERTRLRELHKAIETYYNPHGRA